MLIQILNEKFSSLKSTGQLTFLLLCALLL